MGNLFQDDQQAATRDAALRDLDKLIHETRNLLNLVKDLEVAVQSCRAQYPAPSRPAATGVAPEPGVACTARASDNPTSDHPHSLD